jgi:flagellar motility protein MotE (MotC chaperone)
MVDLATALAAIEPGAGPATSLPEGLDPKALLAVADELKRRREEVERRERSLAEREAALKQVEPRLAAQIAQLEDLKIALEGLLEKVSEEEEQRLARLVKLYESMKPKKAAPIFEQSEPTQLLPIVRRMREAKVAAIIEEMDPLIAKALTAELGRSQPVPGIAGTMEEHVANGSLPMEASRMP